MNLLYSFVTLLICSELVTSEVYFITPSVCSSTEKESCLTLSQFAANASNHPNLNITLSMLPDNHNLHSRLHLTNLDNFSMVSESSTATVSCQIEDSATIFLQLISQVCIENMKFIGCGGNAFHSVGQALLKNVEFIGWESNSSALRLTRTAAQIVSCSFIFNSVGTYAYYHNNEILSVGGALMITHSNISIIYSNFEHNEADLGGALMITHSNISIIKCNFERNLAGPGGVLFAENYSNITVIASTFQENDGTDGGVIFIHVYCSIIIRECQFNDNQAFLGGAMFAEQYSGVTVIASTFALNEGYNGGVFFIHTNSSIMIRECRFSHNQALLGGVVDIRSGIININ